MTRGRRPIVALSDAVQIAGKRGEVRQFRHERNIICNFVIYITGCVAHVRVRRVRRLHFTSELLEREAAHDIAVLRSIASVPGISRELWICSPKGSFRFFAVYENSLVKLDRDGQLLSASLPGPAPAPATSGTVPDLARAGSLGGFSPASR